MAATVEILDNATYISATTLFTDKKTGQYNLTYGLDLTQGQNPQVMKQLTTRIAMAECLEALAQTIRHWPDEDN